jgi:hypothetical protein
VQELALALAFVYSMVAVFSMLVLALVLERNADRLRVIIPGMGFVFLTCAWAIPWLTRTRVGSMSTTFVTVGAMLIVYALVRRTRTTPT